MTSGIIQSDASPWNIPFHTSRLRAAEPECLIAAVGIGVGHVNGPLGRSLNLRSLRRFQHLVVRDADSAERLSGLGLDDAVVGADSVIALEPPNALAELWRCLAREQRRPGRAWPQVEADQTPAATSRRRIASLVRGVYLAALAAGVCGWPRPLRSSHRTRTALRFVGWGRGPPRQRRRGRGPQ